MPLGVVSGVVSRMANDRYELDHVPQARGGMGEVWFGRDIKLEREIAVKFIRYPDGVRDPELDRRFVRESRITARLEHPGVPAVHDVGTYEGRPYLVMQRVRGISVADVVAEHGPLPLGWAAAIAAQVCAVLTVAHAASLVHRDLEPANLMLEPAGTVKVLDFGLAVALDLADVSAITRTGQALGTPAYMAPEQVLAAMSAPASDLYALGCTLHEMLTGEPLFAGPTAYAVMRKQVDEPPSRVRERRPDVPEALDGLVASLLEKEPARRPASAEEVYRRLLPFVTDLGPLPGVLDQPVGPDPVRMYAGVLGGGGDAGALRDAGPPPAPSTQSTRSTPSARHGRPAPARPVAAWSGAAVPANPHPGVGRSDVERARTRAAGLVRGSRYAQAAEVLAAVARPARDALGSADPEVLSLRMELANVLFEGGDYRSAAPEFRDLARDLSSTDGPDSDQVFRCRFQEATCHALVGQTSLALGQLAALYDDERRVFDADDPRLANLRCQIGLLQAGAGRRAAAEETLRGLLTDLVRVHGEAHPMAERVRRILDGLPAGPDR